MKLYKLTAALLLVGLLAGCGADQSAPTQPSTQPTQTTAQTQPVEQTQPEQTATEQPSGIPVELSQITLYYPENWEELIEATVTKDGQNERVTFRAKVGDRGMDIFWFIVGPEETDGFLLGRLNGIFVYSVVNEPAAEDFSAEEYQQLGRQQEYINELIPQFYDAEGFEPA